MVPFAGYDMPVQYPLMLKRASAPAPCRAVRRLAHGAGGAAWRGRRQGAGNTGAGGRAGHRAGKQRYALFTNEAGGILDDLMIFNTGSYCIWW